jgi:hypothetical protein
LYWRPFFGFIDDSALIRYVDQIHQQGNFLQFWWKYAQNDITWGMLRPTYPLMFRFLYESAGKNSVTLFLLNSVWVVISWAILAFGFSRILFLPKNEPFGRSVSRWEVCTLFLLVTFALPANFYAFLFPSLQEKLVMFAGGLLLLLFTSSSVASLPFSSWLPIVALGLSFGVMQKAQFLIFFPTFLALQLYWDVRLNRKWFCRTLAVLLICGIWTLVLQQIAAQGSYTGHLFRSTGLPVGLKHPWTWRMMGLCGIFSIPLLNREWKRNWIFAIPTLLILSYLAIFVRWGVEGYLLISATPGIAFGSCLFFLWAKRKWTQLPIQSIGSALIAFVAIAVTLQRSQLDLSKHGDIRRIVYSDEAREIASKKGAIFTTCNEGSSHLTYYFQAFAGLDIPVIYTSDPADPRRSYEGHPIYWMGDSTYCPMSEQGKAVILSPLRKTGFRLYRLL